MNETKFLPPQQNALLTRLIQSIFYLVMYFVYHIKLEVSDRDVDLLRQIADRRVIYLPNHSNLDDGLVMFLFSARLGQLFHYVVAYEAFQGFIGKLMQWVGAYSIRRGIGDRASILQTLNLIQQPQAKLVIFPEGGCSYQNDTVMPFRTGGIELAFKAIAKLTPPASTPPDLYLVPVSIKYYYRGATASNIAQSLQKLETALLIEPQTDDFYPRLRAIALKVLTSFEAEYQIVPDARADWNQRIEILKQNLLDYCERELHIVPTPQLPNRERVYKIQAILAELEADSPKLAKKYQHLKLTTVRLLNFDAIYDGYVADEPTPERFFATLDRLEREIFQIDRPQSKGLRHVRVKIGTPINLQKYCSSETSDRRAIITQLTQDIQHTVQANLKP